MGSYNSQVLPHPDFVIRNTLRESPERAVRPATSLEHYFISGTQTPKLKGPFPNLKHLKLHPRLLEVL